ELRMADLPAGVSQELPYEVLPSLRGLHGALRQALDFLGVASRIQDEVEIADDDGQKIVEIVCDSTGQQTDRLEALGLSELLSRACELGVACFRDRESLIKAAVQPARLDQQNDRHDARRKQPKEVADVITEVKASGIEEPVERHIEHPGADGNDQPQVEYEIGAGDPRSTRATRPSRQTKMFT